MTYKQKPETLTEVEPDGSFTETVVSHLQELGGSAVHQVVELGERHNLRAPEAIGTLLRDLKAGIFRLLPNRHIDIKRDDDKPSA